MAGGLKRKRGLRGLEIPIVGSESDRILSLYDAYQVVVVRGVAAHAACTRALFSLLEELHGATSAAFGSSFNAESSVSSAAVTLTQVLSSVASGTWHAPASSYFSFILEPRALSGRSARRLARALPIAHLAPIVGNQAQHVRPGDAVWFFVGRNGTAEPLDGRPEHTDDVSSDGTWHLQVCGQKKWRLRPTEGLARRLGLSGRDWCEVTCSAGDVMIINTGAWWHSTSLPQSDVLSFSYARDFCLGDNGSLGAASMTNVEGIYATSDIPVGVVVMTEDDMPDCELQTHDDPNCEVCSDRKSGKLVLVATKNIVSGEFLTIAADG